MSVPRMAAICFLILLGFIGAMLAAPGRFIQRVSFNQAFKLTGERD